MNETTQEKRILQLETPLGKDVLLIQEMTGTEVMSGPFAFQLKVLSEKKTIPAQDIVGKPVSVSLELPSGEKRFFHGIVSRFGYEGEDNRTTHYQTEVVPWLWLLTRTADCRIFQDKTIPEIITLVFGELKKEFPGIVNFEDKTNASRYKRVDYCVQYRETDFEFVSRLMEQEGISYFFRHEHQKHTLVMSDSSDAYPPCEAGRQVTYKADEVAPEESLERKVLKTAFDFLAKTGANVIKTAIKGFFRVILIGFIPGLGNLIDGQVDSFFDNLVRDLERLIFGENPPLQEGVKIWREQEELQAGKSALRDYHFQMPSKSLEVTNPSIVQIGNNGALELFDYPGFYAQRFNKPGQRLGEVEPEGRQLVEIRMQEKEARHRTIRGMSREGIFSAGHHFDLKDHPNHESNGRYVLTAVDHTMTQGDYSSESTRDGGPYRNQFTCIPFDVQYRPARTMVKPTLKGPQSAEVVGLAGEEIYVDKYGRVKVQFHWDREGKKSENSSCWLRVAQLWAGKQWGAIFLPRVGQEVIVDFLEGDPDQPIVIGSVYNAEQMPPYELPANKTQSGIKTRSSMKGTADNFNEIRFEDKKGEEQVLVHAEKDLDTTVEHDESRDVGHNRETTIGADDTLSVGSNRSATVGGSDRETVSGSQSISVGSRSVSVGGQDKLTVGATLDVTAVGPITITAPMITLQAPLVVVSGILQAQSVISPMYSPGVGNLI